MASRDHFPRRLFVLPVDGAVPSVFQDYTRVGELLANGIGAGKVAAFFGGLALFDEGIDGGGLEAGLGGSEAKAREFFGVVVREHGEDAVKFFHRGDEASGVLLAHFAAVHGGIGVAEKVEDGGEGDGSVEVVGEAGVEIGFGPGDAFFEGIARAGGKFFGAQAVHESAEALDGIFGLLEAVGGEIELAAVGDGEQEVTDAGGFLSLGEKIAEGEEVAEGFRHLLALDDEVLGVEPDFDEGFSGGALALGDFVFVVGEGEVHAAGVNVERLAEVAHGHGGAFDVPAGTAGADTGFPEMLAGLGSFPESEVAGVGLFVAVHVNAGAGLDAGHVNFREFAVIGKFRDAEVDGTFAGVGEAFFLELFDEVNHGVNVVGGADDFLGHFEGEGAHVVEKGLDIFFCVLADGDAFDGGILDDAVVHVGEIHDVEETIAAGAQVAAEDVLEDEGAEVADVREVVDGGAAGVHADFARMNRVERFERVGESVVETNLGGVGGHVGGR